MLLELIYVRLANPAGLFRYEAQQMSGSIQSSNYVPGVSGWKFSALTGDYEINSSNIAVGSLPTDPQPITITAGEWSDYDLPANAVERHAFIGAELEKIPAECRNSAEFTTEDISFDRDGSDYRTTLTYVRQETQEEAKARQEKAKVSGTRIVSSGGCATIICDGVVRARFGNLDQPEPEQAKPFKVDGDKVYISEAAIQDGIIKSPWPMAWGVRMQLRQDGKYYAAGLGLGMPSQILVSVDRFAIKPSAGEAEMIDALSGVIGITQLCKSMKAEVDKMKLDRLAEQGQVDAERLLNAEKVKDVIRAELRQGGLLWRRS